MARMTDRELAAFLDTELENSLGYDSGSTLALNREKAIEYFEGQPRGDEVEGSSHVQSTDVADVIERILPSVVKTFLQSDQIVRFDPRGPEDEDQADLESRYVSHVILKENDGFELLCTWFRDALLLKNGYVATGWEEKSHVKRETFKGISAQQLELYDADPEYELVDLAVRAEQGDPGIPPGVFPLSPSPGAPGSLPLPFTGPPAVYDAVFIRRQSTRRVQIEPVPPEDLLVNADHSRVSLNDARFVARRLMLCAYELIERGIPADVVDDLPTAMSHEHTTPEKYARNAETEDDYAAEIEAAQRSLRQIEVYECYPMIDYFDDGTAQRRHMLYCKDAREVLENETWEYDDVPISALTGTISPHKHNGRSVYDRIKEIQDQKTAILRQTLNNLYRINNARTVVSKRVNWLDLMINRPGGHVRVDSNDAVGNHVMPFPVANVGPAAFAMMEYLDKVREERGGVGPTTTLPALNLPGDTAHGIERVMSALEELVGLIIRTFADTGVKDLALKVRRELHRHPEAAKHVELGGKWALIDTSQWEKRTGATVRVGLGTGDQMKQFAAASGLFDKAMSVMATPIGPRIFTPQNLHALYKEMVRVSPLQGLVDEITTDPEAIPPPPPPPDYQMVMMQMQQQLAQQADMTKRLGAQLSTSVKMRELEIKQNEQERRWEEMYQVHATKLTELELEHDRNVPGALT